MPGLVIKLEEEKKPMDVRNLALTAHANAGLSTMDTPLATAREVDDYGTRDAAPMNDLSGNDPFLPEKTQNRVKQEMVNDGDGSSNDNSNAMPHIYH